MDNVTDITTQILVDIRNAIREQGDAIRVQGDAIRVQGDAIRAQGESIRSLGTALLGLRDEVRGMRVDLCERIDRTNARIDNLIAVTGSAHRAHDARLDQLDARVTRLEVTQARDVARTREG